MLKRKPRRVTVSTPQKGRSKANGGIPLDKRLAAKPRDGVCRTGIMSKPSEKARRT